MDDQMEGNGALSLNLDVHHRRSYIFQDSRVRGNDGAGACRSTGLSSFHFSVVNFGLWFFDDLC